MFLKTLFFNYNILFQCRSLAYVHPVYGGIRTYDLHALTTRQQQQLAFFNL